MLVCLNNSKDLADLNAVVISNFETVMAAKKFFMLDLNKKPVDVYNFSTKI